MELWSHGNTRKRSWSRVYLFPCLVRFPSKNTLLVEKLKDFSENRISKVTKNGVEKYFSKSEERSEWKNWNMGFLSPVYLYTWPPSVYEPPKRDDYVGGTKGDICRVVVKNE